MQIGMIGLGRMGANMARRLMKGGHECVVYDRSAETVDALAKEGAVHEKGRRLGFIFERISGSAHLLPPRKAG